MYLTDLSASASSHSSACRPHSNLLQSFNDHYNSELDIPRIRFIPSIHFTNPPHLPLDSERRRDANSESARATQYASSRAHDGASLPQLPHLHINRKLARATAHLQRRPRRRRRLLRGPRTDTPVAPSTKGASESCTDSRAVVHGKAGARRTKRRKRTAFKSSLLYSSSYHKDGPRTRTGEAQRGKGSQEAQ